MKRNLVLLMGVALILLVSVIGFASAVYEPHTISYTDTTPDATIGGSIIQVKFIANEDTSIERIRFIGVSGVTNYPLDFSIITEDLSAPITNLITMNGAECNDKNATLREVSHKKVLYGPKKIISEMGWNFIVLDKPLNIQKRDRVFY